ncbi:hypothetical protein [Bailinhaonella thermotolerans]|uniref:Uncharacterized protein n=1 Tax=Bailinhaonella thermotolerans TaxID=1070861 RepID=A0A3A4AZK6_9ACTN|nr:hypothetical protein [Bailinhaonella thermotolerans]RJL35817.1 hypothetical protein D5H75_03285 [Bailinhaonella thermotolerans]
MSETAGHSLLDLDSDTLYILIGRAVLAAELKSTEPEDEESRATGRAWFERNLATFRKAVCSSVRIRRQVLAPGKVERNMLFAGLVDALAAAGGFPVPVTVIAAQIVHFGVGRLCPNLSGAADD